MPRGIGVVAFRRASLLGTTNTIVVNVFIDKGDIAIVEIGLHIVVGEIKIMGSRIKTIMARHIAGWDIFSYTQMRKHEASKVSEHTKDLVKFRISDRRERSKEQQERAHAFSSIHHITAFSNIT